MNVIAKYYAILTDFGRVLSGYAAQRYCYIRIDKAEGINGVDNRFSVDDETGTRYLTPCSVYRVEPGQHTVHLYTQGKVCDITENLTPGRSLYITVSQGEGALPCVEHCVDASGKTTLMFPRRLEHVPADAIDDLNR